MIEHEMDRVRLERTVALVRDGVATKGEGQQLTKALRVAIDSRPLVGAGRVEDTLNLLGDAARSIVRMVSRILSCEPEQVCRKAGVPLLLAPSIKAGLDIDWSDARQKATAIEIVESQVSALQQWVERNIDQCDKQPLRPYLEAITTVREQDLERTSGGTMAIRKGVAFERRISIEDAEMRHGRKSSSKRFDGYKEHIARDLDVPAIVACAVTAANRPEEEGAAPIAADIKSQGLSIEEVHVDRAYISSQLIFKPFVALAAFPAAPLSSGLGESNQVAEPQRRSWSWRILHDISSSDPTSSSAARSPDATAFITARQILRRRASAAQGDRSQAEQ